MHMCIYIYHNIYIYIYILIMMHQQTNIRQKAAALRSPFIMLPLCVIWV